MSQITSSQSASSMGAITQITADVGVAIPVVGNINVVGGTGVSTSAAGSTLTINVTGTTFLTYKNVNTTPYVVLATDEYLSVDTSALSITVRLPNTTTTGRVFIIKDRSGQSFTRNITVTTVGGAVLIDGLASQTLNINYNSLQVLFNGSAYEVF